MRKTGRTNRQIGCLITLSIALLSLGSFHPAFILAPAAQASIQAPPIQSWGTEISNPQSVILCIHGLGLHKGAFSDFAKRMNQNGTAVYAIDLRGFGDWHLNGDDKLDFAQSLVDIKQAIEIIKKQYPHAAIFLLGESMGGAVALRAASMYPDQIRGLISAVPSGDRFSGLGQDLSVGFHALLGGFGGRFNVGKHVVEHATKIGGTDQVDEKLRKRWSDDSAVRSNFSPDELITFQNFMNKNNETAQQVKTTPVLVLQGAHDKLVHGSGTYNVWDHLATPDRTFAASKTAEHLIFEYGQFSQDDINYVVSWMKKVLAPLPSQTVSADLPEPAKPKVPSKDELLASTPDLLNQPKRSSIPNAVTTAGGRPGTPVLSYWIELKRDGKRYSCNNKTSFRSGDEIRIHLICSSNGYAYILMKQGSSGAHAVLFPEARTGRNNAVTAGSDYALPSATWLKFDENPGTEKICLIFSPQPLDPDTNKYMNSHNVIVTADKSGAKDLCPTRAQLSWDDPNPLIMPLPTANVSSASLVKYSQDEDLKSVISIDIDLEHQK